MICDIYPKHLNLLSGVYESSFSDIIYSLIYELVVVLSFIISITLIHQQLSLNLHQLIVVTLVIGS